MSRTNPRRVSSLPPRRPSFHCQACLPGPAVNLTRRHRSNHSKGARQILGTSIATPEEKLRGSCHGCKRFRAKAYQAPPPVSLPETRTQGSTPFQAVEVDFAGPIRYRLSTKKESKAYLYLYLSLYLYLYSVLYGCSLTRAVHLDLVKSLETTEFLASLKRFIARRRRPEIIYSDNDLHSRRLPNGCRKYTETSSSTTSLLTMPSSGS